MDENFPKELRKCLFEQGCQVLRDIYNVPILFRACLNNTDMVINTSARDGEGEKVNVTSVCCRQTV